MDGMRILNRLVAALAAAALVGCGGDPAARPKEPAAAPKATDTAAPPAAKATAKEDGHDHHDHGAGPHGGVVFELGGGKYHAEFNVDHGKKEAAVYVLGGADEKKYAPVKATTALLSIKQPAFLVDLKAAPQKEDPAGASSAFLGKDEKLGVVKEFEGTLTIEIDGKPYSGDFKELPHDEGHDAKGAKKDGKHADVGPGVGGTPAEKELFLKPGGIYTAADIKANGNTVPSAKFAGVSWPHDDDLKPGDKLCPVTANKADARCFWTVNGKKYEFCCTPCLDKFVKWAKTSPEKIKPPEAYVYMAK